MKSKAPSIKKKRNRVACSGVYARTESLDVLGCDALWTFEAVAQGWVALAGGLLSSEAEGV